MRLVIIFITIYEVIGVLPDAHLNRNKRFVIFPFGGSYKMVLGIGMPVMLSKQQSLSFAFNFQFQYPPISNITQIQSSFPPIISRRRRHTISERALTYMALEGVMDKYEIRGKQCLLRSICENALHSVDHDANGLYGQLIHIILSPDIGDDNEGVDKEYLDAKNAGEFGVDCLSLYPDCPLGHSILDIISVLDDV